MKNIIKRIFEEFKYKSFTGEYNKDEIDVYEFKDKEYFLVSYFCENDLIEYFNSKKTDDIFTAFDCLKKGREDAIKNTSLIIFVELDNLKSDYIKLKNQIFKIEEDEYFFKKNIIVYDRNSIKNFAENRTISNFLQSKILENNKFLEYQKDNFCCLEYFFIIQLFVKLPFLVLKKSDEDYECILNIIKKELINKKMAEFDTNYFSYREKNIEDFSKLKELFITENKSEEINDFFEYLEVKNV